MITTLALSALALPPRAEVMAGVSGNAAQSYSYVTAQPALLRSDRAKLLARVSVSHLYYSYPDGTDLTRVNAPGLSVGPAVVFTPKDLSLSAGVSVGARHFSTRQADRPHDRQVTADVSLSGDAFWRPGQRANLYSQFSLGAVSGTLWARLGATYPVTPRARPVSLWLGLDGTGSGPIPHLSTEIGAVGEVPVAPLRATLGVRAATPVRDLGQGLLVSSQSTLGLSVYWSY